VACFSEGAGWRWTAPVFAVALDPPTASKPVFLELDFTVPEKLKLPVTVTGTVNGVVVARRAYDRAGRTLLACPVPASALTRRPAAVEFSVDRTCTDPGTSRVQGIIAVSVGLKEYQQTAEYRDAEMANARQDFNHVVEQQNLQMPMKVFHELPIWASLWCQNVRIIKKPLDLWMLQQIAYEVRPDFIVETGTWYGGLALWRAHTHAPMVKAGGYIAVEDTHLDGAPRTPSRGPDRWPRYGSFSANPRGRTSSRTSGGKRW
jgi:hypothetical protein